MVASVSALSSAAQAASYYEADDYYAEGGMAPSEWYGEAAEKLGLSGEVLDEIVPEEGAVPRPRAMHVEQQRVRRIADAACKDVVLYSNAYTSRKHTSRMLPGIFRQTYKNVPRTCMRFI